MRTAALLFGGVMAGIAGASLTVGNVPTFIEGMSAGRGFIALAIVTSGRWNPWGCLIAALVFGFVSELQIVGQAMQICGIAGYKNEGKYSLGLQLRDAHLATLMINNDRIHQTNASLLLVHKDD